MTASCSDGHGDLLAGLPDELVLISIITRLPWFTRPVCRAVSKAWRAWIDTSTKRPQAVIRSREHYLPLLQECILLSVFHFRTFVVVPGWCQGRPEESGYRRIEWGGATYKVDRRWRELSSLHELFPQNQPQEMLTRTASNGIVYAWADDEGEFVVKMDVAGGDWAWEKVPLPYLPSASPICVDGELHLVSFCDNLRLVRGKGKSSGMVQKDQLYSLVEHGLPIELTLEIFAFDDYKEEAWKAREMIAVPYFTEWADIEDVQLVNGDCFEPAPDEGINIVWADSVFRWFNSSVSQAWVEFECNARGAEEGKVCPQFIHGWLYGLFVDLEDNDEEPEIGSGRQKPACAIMKGKMVVEQNQVVWEQILDLHWFQESCSLEHEVVPPLHSYTVMI